MKNLFITILSFSISIHIANSQNVGIGTTNPSAKLEVIGDSNSVQSAIVAKLTNIDNAFSSAIVGNAFSHTGNIGHGIGGFFIGGFNGIRAFGFGENGSTIGVYGEGNSAGFGNSFGVVGTAVNTSNNKPSYGVYGSSSNNNGYGVFSYGMVGIQKPFNMINVYDPLLQIQLSGQGTTFLNAIDMTYEDSSNQGCRLVSRNTPLGGLNVVNPDSLHWAPIHAASYNIASDERLKKNIQPIHGEHITSFLRDFRNVETASYYYKYESKDNSPWPHIGVLAQTMPKETVVLDYENTDGSGAKRLHVSLSDWLGLVTVVAKENDRRVLELEKENKELKERLLRLEGLVLEMSSE